MKVFGNVRIEETTLYYLYMLVDGNVTNKKKDIFDDLCRELKVDSDEKKEIINICKKKIEGQASVLDVIVTEKFDEQVGRRWMGLRDASSLARVIWNLVNLGYADSKYSEEEKKIIQYLMDKWSVSLEVYQEFIDVSETLLSLEQYRGWISSVYPKGRLGEKKKKNVENEIQMLLDDIQLTISEAAM